MFLSFTPNTNMSMRTPHSDADRGQIKCGNGAVEFQIRPRRPCYFVFRSTTVVRGCRFAVDGLT